ncbi:ABC transporter permease [Chitinophaga sp. sic0106]|uniref:ABC transporter permease n=1 Tax=Chitinophaga sp. sic0106 TaxID=2854785 RepID=UPI001C46FCFA|nr:ABC transporter permease [Chitinophaga sp. sic0106]MBV7529440.1 ABC transporter permease [Chitinophaga sp. sic0106]
MIHNYILIAWRNLLRYRLYTLINLTGLTIGLAACWVLLLYVYKEKSYDTYFDKGDRIYRVVNAASWTGGNLNLASTSAPFGPVLQRDYPEVETALRIAADGNNTLESGNKRYDIGSLFITDPTFFKVFNFKSLAGNAETALNAPGNIVLTKTTAVKMFGSPEAAIGKAVVINKPSVYQVAAVVDDVPVNTHFQFEAVRAMPADYHADGWQNFELYTYLLLKPGASADGLQTKLKGFYDKYLKQYMGEGVSFNMTLQPLTTIHLQSHLSFELGANGNVVYVYIFLCAAILILLIGCINYMNLSTARAVVRTREVGVRKALGSDRWQVAMLFIAEALILTLVAVVVAFALVVTVLPAFNNITGVSLHIWDAGIGVTVIAVLLVALGTALLAGAYPALIMSGFNMINSLKGHRAIPSHSAFRKGLVVFQFCIAILLAVSANVAYRQLQYVTTTDIGFNKHQLLTFHLPDQESRHHIAAIKQQLLENKLIKSVTASSNPIGDNNIGTNGFLFEQSDGRMPSATLLAQNFYVDADFIPTMGIKVIQGRNLSDKGDGDRYHGVLINETLVKKLGYTNPIGKRVEFAINDKNISVSRVIVGVVKDFHIYSLQHKVAPLVLRMAPVPEMEDNLFVRISSENIPQAIAWIEKVYHQYEKENTFSYRFLDEAFGRQYEKERVQERVFMMFTLLALFIACLGLLGLAAFTAVQRNKEIGIRKVLGASVWGIVGLLSLDFIKLVLIAIAVTVPVAWWYMGRWLDQFAYHIHLNPEVFIITALTVLAVALLTVSYHAIKAAVANPAKSLKSAD